MEKINWFQRLFYKFGPLCEGNKDREHHEFIQTNDIYKCDLYTSGDNLGRLTRRIGKCRCCGIWKNDELFIFKFAIVIFYIFVINARGIIATKFKQS